MQLTYLIRRLAFLVFVVWSAITLLFFLPRLSPINPVRERFAELQRSTGWAPRDLERLVKVYEVKFGLNKPLHEQYLEYMGSLLRGDLGYSIMRYPRTVGDLIAQALPWTIGLLTVTTLLTFAIGTGIGALAAWPRSPQWVKGMVTPLVVLAAIPPYLLGLLLIYFVAFRAKLLPMGGAYTLGRFAEPELSVPFLLDVARHAILPALSLILSTVGFWALGMRGMGVTVQGEDYVTFAEHKGLDLSRIFYAYYVRNAILPQVTALALAFGSIVSSGILVEYLYGFPGLGSLLNAAILANDFFVIYGIGLITILAVAVSMMVVDLLYPLLDPRIRYTRA
ncbi:MAG: ABC transporter permease [Anaerolineae bacterium]|nr:ABC transporter permease [Thermoflexales bacterium]MDW8054772.1 ABC transporter permease [Anaerolineae bacterium]MDW8292890.1 ABC transporter permease [Anaerolineae bacterium]